MNIRAHLAGERPNVLGRNLNLILNPNLNLSPHVLAWSKNKITIKNKSVILT